jgi:predicted transcriptional regulator
MGKPKIDRVKLSQMLRDGKPQKDIAESMGVSEAAISKAKKELNINVVKNVALENAHRVVDKSLNTVDQLERINKVANQLLDELTGEDQTIDRMVKAVEGSLVYEGDPINQKEYIRRVILRVNQDKNTALKACGELRNQLKFQLEIFQTLYDMKAVQEFQQEVLTAIGEVNPDVRRRIIHRLQERSALRRAVSFG